ncbi:MAG: 50S ribosomal protein L23 [Gammaproteobacteria bacterium]|nr:50S ribosomal protein L23 [Gammaproteobacteria bacterium]
MTAAYAKERLMSVVLGPHMSEKAAVAGERDKQIVFRVRRDSSKAEIRRAVELLFDVKVEAVQVVGVKGKAKRFGRTPGRRQDWKKAYVSLAEGSDINFLGTD